MMARRSWKTACYFLILLVFTPGFTSAASLDTAGNTLDDISYTALPGNQIQLRLKMSKPTQKPGSFTVDSPPRIALDFPDTKNLLANKTRSIGIGAARSLITIEAGGRTRVVINLTRLVPYETRLEGNDVIVTLQPHQQTAPGDRRQQTLTAKAGGPGIHNIDFRRGAKGEGRVIVTLSDPNAAVDVSKQGEKLLVTIQNTALPEELERRLDVIDFATPVQTIDTFQLGKDVRMMVTASGRYDHIGYQTDNTFTIDIKPIAKAKTEAKKQDKFGYSGERLSLNFQNIEVRAVLQLIADFTGLNMVTSDAVSGSLTLRLKNVPWDQALDIILKTKGLAKRKSGNVMLIGPAAEIASQEKVEMEATRQIEELAPLRNKSIQVNYAKASEIAALIQTGKTSLLSERGTITIDTRTNKLLVQDVDERILAIRRLVQELDIPVKQVLIETRVVIAHDDFSRDLGVRFGVTRSGSDDGSGINTSGSLEGTDSIVNNATTLPGLGDRLNVSLPVVGNAPSLALAILHGNTLVDLELSALQLEGKGKIVSNPRVVTANGNAARIEQGVEVPYQEASASGATSVSFKKAVLSLEVTPQITPDNRVIMDLQVNKDSVGTEYFGIPSIDTNEIQTQVLVNNGETIVLGGVYEQTKSKTVSRVPFFGDLPFIGALFRNTTDVDEKSELLIFVTPKILNDISVL